MPQTESRADRHNNPIACDTAVAAQGGLRLGIDYEVGDSFKDGNQIYHTARFLGDPVELAIQVIRNVGYRTRLNAKRWTYMDMPLFVVHALSHDVMRDVVGKHYENEGGTKMRHLFPNFGAK